MGVNSGMNNMMEMMVGNNMGMGMTDMMNPMMNFMNMQQQQVQLLVFSLKCMYVYIFTVFN